MTTLRAPALDRAFQLAASQVADGIAPWVVLGVADTTGTVRLEAFPGPGAAHVSTDTVCLLASITKPIVATVVMQLVAEGRLVLTEPLDRLLPEVAAVGGPPFTAWHVLSHTSGLGDLEVEALLARGATHADAVRELLRLPRLSDPGATFRYATSPFDLLGALIARLDGRPYPEALHARLLGPLGMGSTTFDPRGPLWDRAVQPLAAPLAEAGGIPDAIADAYFRMAMPGGGLWGTAPDLLRFGRAMVRGGELDGVRVLPRSMVELMSRETTVGGIGGSSDPVSANHYALGWGKPGVATPGSPAAFGHGGVSGTRLWIDPPNDLVFVYLTGVWGFPNDPIDAVMNAVYAALP